MTRMQLVKRLVLFLAPLLLFVLLLIPYSWVNQQFIVEWFGCGCPQVDAAGHLVESSFNANDFTALFWGAVSLAATGIAAGVSRRIPKDKWWLRSVYVVAILLLSLLISQQFCRMMMWN